MNELIAAIETMDPEGLAAVILMFAGYFTVVAVVAVIRYLMAAIGYSKMFRKAGIAGWKAFIPLYNHYNEYKICWNGKIYFLALALYVVITALANSTNFVLSLIAAAGGITLIVIAVKQNIKMAKAFGKGAGTGILLILFPGITSLVLGFGKAEYTAITE